MPYDEEYSVIARFYDGDYDHFRTPSGDVAFYVEEARRSGGPVLELGCGTGRVLVPIARAGIAVTGLDSSEPMLNLLREKLPDADVHRADMRDFDLGREFRLVTIPFRAIGHILDAEDHVRVFENVRRHLAPGGRFVFDFYHPDPRYFVGEPVENLNFEREEEGRKIRRYATSVPDRSTQISAVHFRWEVEDEAGGIEHFASDFPMRWFQRFELEHALRRAGLKVDALWGDFDRSSFAKESPDMIFVASAA